MTLCRGHCHRRPHHRGISRRVWLIRNRLAGIRTMRPSPGAANTAYTKMQTCHRIGRRYTVGSRPVVRARRVLMQSENHQSARFPIVALWSAPRCRSTAFARMMMERGDYMVLHEPFSHVINFGESEVGEHLVRSERELIPALGRLARDAPVFFKDTTDFYYPCLLSDKDFLARGTHTFLIRHPAEAIASHYLLHPGLQRDEIGFAWLAEIFETL